MKTIASRPTREEIEFVKRMGTVHEAGRMLIEAGGMDIFQRIITDPIFRSDLIAFVNNYVPSALNYAALLKWFQDNKLERFLSTGSLEKIIKEQENFYQMFYGPIFRIDRKKIFVDIRRLPAIKAGLEAGCLNYALLKVTTDFLTKTETRMTEAEFFYDTILKGIKGNGFKIWAETGTDRWTNLELAELLQRCNPMEPDEFDVEAFKEDWAKEVARINEEKGSPSKIIAGTMEMIFTSNSVDIPSNQIIVNKDGEIVALDDRSYVSAIAKNVRVLSSAEGIILTSQMYVKDKTYLAPDNWEWRRDVIVHRDTGSSPNVSVASACSNACKFCLNSDGAGDSDDGGRLRLAL